MWRDVKVVGVGDVVRGFSRRPFVCAGRCRSSSRWPGRTRGRWRRDYRSIVIEVRASALFECLGGWIDDAHACEVVCCLAVRQYVKQAEEVSADDPGGHRDCREEEEIALVVVVLFGSGRASP